MAYTIRRFIDDAKTILDCEDPLADKQRRIGERMVDLCQRDDLTSYGAIIGPSDASFNSYMLWREPPHLYLGLAQFEPHYRSPIHEHGDHWVVSAGYRGHDRWDIYERLDDGSTSGRASLELVSQVDVVPGAWAALPAPPRSIHSHNNPTSGFACELIFSATKPLAAEDRLLFDLDEGTCRRSWFGAAQHLLGDTYPPAGGGDHS